MGLTPFRFSVCIRRQPALKNSGERTATVCRELSFQRCSVNTFRRSKLACGCVRFFRHLVQDIQELCLCPTNSPSAVNDAMAATAPANRSRLGRITEQSGKFGLMNSHGTGKIRLGWNSGVPGVRKKLGKVRPSSETGATGGCTPLPEKSTHSKK
jgi:hypothetical protein